jgi:hypothetical protein
MEQENGVQWAIVELMGHKVVAGMAGKSELFGDAMLRIDVPATSAFPAFTQMYGTAAIYAITFVSEEVAKLTAEHAKVNPVSVYVPELITRERMEEYEEKIRILQQNLREARQLPHGGLSNYDEDLYRDPFDEDNDEEDIVDEAKFPN